MCFTAAADHGIITSSKRALEQAIIARTSPSGVIDSCLDALLAVDTCWCSCGPSLAAWQTNSGHGVESRGVTVSHAHGSKGTLRGRRHQARACSKGSGASPTPSQKPQCSRHEKESGKQGGATVHRVACRTKIRTSSCEASWHCSTEIADCRLMSFFHCAWGGQCPACRKPFAWHGRCTRLGLCSVCSGSGTFSCNVNQCTSGCVRIRTHGAVCGKESSEMPGLREVVHVHAFNQRRASFSIPNGVGATEPGEGGRGPATWRRQHWVHAWNCTVRTCRTARYHELNVQPSYTVHYSESAVPSAVRCSTGPSQLSCDGPVLLRVG